MPVVTGVAVGGAAVVGATAAFGSVVAIKLALGTAAGILGLFSGLALTVGTGMSVGGQVGALVGHVIADSVTFCVLNSSSAPLIF